MRVRCRLIVIRAAKQRVAEQKPGDCRLVERGIGGQLLASKGGAFWVSAEGLKTLASHWRPTSGKQVTPNSQCFAGTPWRFDFAITLGGNPFDLTGAGLWFTAKTSPAATAVVFQKTLGAGITVTAPASGIGLIQLEPGDTSGLASRQVQLYFDL